MINTQRPHAAPRRSSSARRIERVGFEQLSCAVEPIEPAAVRPHPQRACAIFRQGVDAMIAQCIGSSGIVSVVGKRTRCTIEAIESIAERTDPQRAEAILENDVRYFTERSRLGGVMAIMVKAPGNRIVSGETHGRTNSCRACPVHRQGAHSVVEERVGILGIVGKVQESAQLRMEGVHAVAIRPDPAQARFPIGPDKLREQNRRSNFGDRWDRVGKK